MDVSAHGSFSDAVPVAGSIASTRSAGVDAASSAPAFERASRSGAASPWFALTLSGAFHASVLAAFAFVNVDSVHSIAAPITDIELHEIEAPPPPPPPVAEPEPPPPKPEPQRRARVAAPPVAEPEPSPPPVQPEPPAPVPEPPAAAPAPVVAADVGTLAMPVAVGAHAGIGAANAVGRAATGTGTSLAAVTGRSPAPAVDRSRTPGLAGGASWDCPFPEEADDAGLDSAVVTLQVGVTASGSVKTVSVTDDPGYGFAREARRCALQKRWQAGLDRAGNPVAAEVAVRVRFTR